MCGISAAEDWGCRLAFTEGGVDGILEGVEGSLGFLLGGDVAGDGDIDYAAGGDIRRKEDRRKFNLDEVKC